MSAYFGPGNAWITNFIEDYDSMRSPRSDIPFIGRFFFQGGNHYEQGDLSFLPVGICPAAFSPVCMCPVSLCPVGICQVVSVRYLPDGFSTGL